jgi:phosphatidylglycerophosphate synthase
MDRDNRGHRVTALAMYTLSGHALGIIGAALFPHTLAIAAIFLGQAIDATDGSIARAHGLVSDTGELLDHYGDRIVAWAFFLRLFTELDVTAVSFLLAGCALATAMVVATLKSWSFSGRFALAVALAILWSL